MYACMYVCIRMYVCMCIHMYVYVCIYVRIYECTYVCMCVYICMCMYVFMYVSMYVCMYVCVYTYVCVCMYLCTYLCLYVFTSVYSHGGDRIICPTNLCLPAITRYCTTQHYLLFARCRINLPTGPDTSSVHSWNQRKFKNPPNFMFVPILATLFQIM